MARHENQVLIAPKRLSDGPAGTGPANPVGHPRIGPRLSVRNGKHGTIDFSLEFAPSAGVQGLTKHPLGIHGLPG